MPVHEAVASRSVNLVLKHEKNNVTAAQVSASPCFVKLHEQFFKMCIIMKMNGLSKPGIQLLATTTSPMASSDLESLGCVDKTKNGHVGSV